MNFFGHAWVAGWFSEREPYLLGSMLPDLANMLRAAVPRAFHPELAAGVRMHHDTDRVFHASESFQALEQHARLSLAAAGLPKGPRRALAHIGVEFLIDDELGSHGSADSRLGAASRYTAALAFGGSSACRSMLHWSNNGEEDRFAALCQRLLAASSLPPSPRRDTAALAHRRLADGRIADRRIAGRLVACLAGRPRLALQPSEEAALEPWLAECRPAVAAATPALIDELSRGLDAPLSGRLAAE